LRLRDLIFLPFYLLRSSAHAQLANSSDTAHDFTLKFLPDLLLPYLKK